jgi:hypothetical protein
MAINIVGSRSAAIFSKPKANPKSAVIQLGKGGFSYLGISFKVVSSQLPSVIISLAVMKFLASMMVTGITFRLKRKMEVPARKIRAMGLFFNQVMLLVFKDKQIS